MCRGGGGEKKECEKRAEVFSLYFFLFLFFHCSFLRENAADAIMALISSALPLFFFGRTTKEEHNDQMEKIIEVYFCQE